MTKKYDIYAGYIAHNQNQIYVYVSTADTVMAYFKYIS